MTLYKAAGRPIGSRPLREGSDDPIARTRPALRCGRGTSGAEPRTCEAFDAPAGAGFYDFGGVMRWRSRRSDSPPREGWKNARDQQQRALAHSSVP